MSNLNSRELGEDLAFFLYLAPVIAAIIFGIYEWIHFGPHSAAMPADAYVVVSKSSYLFLGALVSVCIGFILEVRGTPLGERTRIISVNSTRMQMLAVTILIISFAAAVSAGGYNVGSAASDFLAGRYALIFAFFLLGFSILLSPKQLLGNVKLNSAPEFVGLLLMAASPFIFDLVHKAGATFWQAGGTGIVALVFGAIIILSGSRIFKKGGSQERSTASQGPAVVPRES